jgi:hypothetical protein
LADLRSETADAVCAAAGQRGYFADDQGPALEEHAALDSFELKKSIEANLKTIFAALGNLDRESTKIRRSPASGNI